MCSQSDKVENRDKYAGSRLCVKDSRSSLTAADKVSLVTGSHQVERIHLLHRKSAVSVWQSKNEEHT